MDDMTPQPWSEQPPIDAGPNNAPVAPTVPSATAPPSAASASAQPTAPPDQHGVGAMLGHAFKSLVTGTQPTYDYDANGNLVTKQVPMPRNQFFKNIIASSILSGAAGDGGTFAQGVVRGAGASVLDQRNRDLQARQQALQQLAARQKAMEIQAEKQRMEFAKNAEQRATAAESRAQEAFKFQQMLNNIQKTHLEFQARMDGLEERKRLVEIGQANAAPYRDAGILPAQTMTDAEYTKHLAEHDPAMAEYDWWPTKLEPHVNPDGTVEARTTYEGYKKNVTIALPQSTKDQWAKAGYTEFVGDNGVAVPIKAGMTMTPQQRQMAQKQYLEKYSDWKDKQKFQLDLEKEKATIGELKARTAEAYAQRDRAKLDIDAGRALKDQKDALAAYDKALDETKDADKAFASLNSTQQRAVVDSYKPWVDSSNARLKEISDELQKLGKTINSTDPSVTKEDKDAAEARLPDLLNRQAELVSFQRQIDKMNNKRAGVVAKPAPPPPDRIEEATKFLSALPPEKQLADIESSKVFTPEEKAELKKRLNLSTGTAEEGEKAKIIGQTVGTAAGPLGAILGRTAGGTTTGREVAKKVGELAGKTARTLLGKKIGGTLAGDVGVWEKKE